MKKLVFFLLLSTAAFAQKPVPPAVVISLTDALSVLNSNITTKLLITDFTNYTGITASTINAHTAKLATLYNTTITVGSTTTTAVGTAPTVTNGGSGSAVVLNFTFPLPGVGPAGAAGAQGIQGIQGPTGATGPAGSGGTYTLPVATSSVLGGIKIGSGLSIDANGVVTAATTPVYPAGDYSQLGSVIADAGGYYNNDATYSPAKVFDGSSSTFYNASSGSNTNVYVGRNLGVAKWVNQVTLLPRQDASYSSRINGAVVQSSPDGTTWTTQYTVAGVNSGNYTQTITASFAYTQAQYWRLFWSAAGGEGNVAEMTIGSVSASSGSSGSTSSSGFPSQIGTLVTTMTVAGVQAAVDSYTPGTPIVLAGTYDFSGNTLQVGGKTNIVFISYAGATFDGGTANNLLVKVYNCTGVTFNGIKFTTASTANGYGMLLFNEQGSTKDLTVTKCEFTAPSGTGAYNAISGNAWSNTVNNVYFDNLSFTDNYFHDLPRMGIEILAHSWDGVIHITNVRATANRFYNLGTATDDGMCFSSSGQIQNVQVINNRGVQFRGYGVEFIGTQDFEASGNLLVSTKTFGGSNNYGSCGFNITDGGNTDGGNPNRNPRKGTIYGGEINVAGRPFVLYYANDVSFSGGYLTGTFIQPQHCNRLTFTGLQMESTYQSNFQFDNSSYCLIADCRLSTQNAVGGKYEQIGFANTSVGNFITGGYLVGSSDNGLQIKVDGSSTGNKWNNVFYGGSLLSN